MALALGKSVGWIEVHISSRELIEWMAYAQLEPFGDERADLRIGHQTTHLLSVLADKKSMRGRTVGDFTLFYEKPPKQPQTPEQLASKFDKLTAKFQA